MENLYIYSAIACGQIGIEYPVEKSGPGETTFIQVYMWFNLYKTSCGEIWTLRTYICIGSTVACG